MAIAMLLCATLTLNLAGLGWLVHRQRPQRVRLAAKLSQLLRLEIELDSRPNSGDAPPAAVDSHAGRPA